MSSECPVPTPAPGTKVNVKCGDDTPCPTAHVASPETLRGWSAYYAGEPEPEYDPRNDYSRGYHSAKGYKTHRESLVWTYKGVEKADDGWYAVLSREEVNSYNDVMNGSGTGLGTHTVTERVKVA